MPPVPENIEIINEENPVKDPFSEDDGENIVISGISGKFPNSKNINDLEYNLFNKIDMVSEDGCSSRREHNMSLRRGIVGDRNRFDSVFFGIHTKQSAYMDPQSKMLVEAAYEAIIDAGVNPTTLKGSKTGVFVCITFSDAEYAMFYLHTIEAGLGITGCSRAMLANRISFALGLTGPSFSVDSNGNAQVLQVAINKMQAGEIDSAIIGGSNLIYFDAIDTQFSRLKMKSNDGFTRVFDKNANGYTRSEAVSCLFLQKKKIANRYYAQVVHCKTNHDGDSDDMRISYSKLAKQKLLNDFYSEINFDFNELGYVEANGTAIPEEDLIECEIIDNIICKKRLKPLLVGSIKSNLGSTDAANPVCAIVKACLILRNRKIPPNLHYKAPNPQNRVLKEGRLRVVTEVEELNKPYVAVNTFSYSGGNVHVLLKGSDNEKICSKTSDDKLARLVAWSGRTEESVYTALNYIESNELDTEFVGLMYKIQKETIPGHVFRGYGVYTKTENNSIQMNYRDVQHYSGVKKPLVWIFSGMGSQWPKMGLHLMELPIFKQSILKSHALLKNHDLDLLHILTSDNLKIFDNILNSFVGIAAIQVALVDVLRALNLEPDYIIGHSVGELGCGYADGGFTAEQMVLAAYYRGKVSVESEKIVGSMAAIGMGYNEIINSVPETIEVACHNSSESCTISGPEKEIAKYVSHLTKKGIFAREVNCSNIAYHSKYISQMGPDLMKFLNKIIPNPKKRSNKWLCSSQPKDKWEETYSQYCSAEYHTNNLLNSVYFEETAAYLPQDCVAIEIAPHGLLQAILRRSMAKNTNIPLTQRGHRDNLLFMLQALGKLHLNGIAMPLDKLYPPIKFPVSRGTANLSSLMRWDHTIEYVKDFSSNKNNQIVSGEFNITIDLKIPKYEFLNNYRINKERHIPVAYLLNAIALNFGKMNKISFTDMNFELTSIEIFKNVLLDDEDFDLNILIDPGNGYFSVSNSGAEIITGVIKELEENEVPNSQAFFKTTSSPTIFEKDFYIEQEIRGNIYPTNFKCVRQAKVDSSEGEITWNSNFAAFLDCLIQFYCLQYDTKNPMMLNRLRSLKFFGKNHKNYINATNILDVKYDRISDCLKSGGIELTGILVDSIEKNNKYDNILFESIEFLPHFPTPILTKVDAINVCAQIILENYDQTEKLVVTEIDTCGYEPIIQFFSNYIINLSNRRGKFSYLTRKNMKIPGIQVFESEITVYKNYSIIIGSEILNNICNKEKISNMLKSNSFLISRETTDFNLESLQSPQYFNLVGIIRTELESLVLLRRKPSEVIKNIDINYVNAAEKNMSWIKSVQQSISKNIPIFMYTRNENQTGVLGLVNSLNTELKKNVTSCLLIDDKKAPPFNPEDLFYKTYLDLGLTVNVFKNGKWGSYRNLKMNTNFMQKQQTGHFYGDIESYGDLTTLNWYQGYLNPIDSDIKIAYASIGLGDAVLATGHIIKPKINQNRFNNFSNFGNEFAGIDIKSGKRVMGVCLRGALSSYIKTDSGYIWEVPKDWSLREAATIPLSYLMVYYALFRVGHARKGKSILIHSAAGGIGLAAVRVSLAYGLKVFVTVGSDHKKKFLLESFPQLKENDISSSRNTSFENMIKSSTSNGVDYIINSLYGEKLDASIRCLRPRGHFLNFNNYDLVTNKNVGMGIFMRELNFHSVSIPGIFKANSVSEIMNLKKLITQDIERGIIQPLFSTVYRANELERAFRHVISGNNIGKIIIEFTPNPASNKSHVVTMIPKINLNSKLSYIVFEGHDVFSMEIIDWLIIRGARKILIHTKKNLSPLFREYRIFTWKKYGVKIVTTEDSIETLANCENVIIKAHNTLGSIGGIFIINSSFNAENFVSVCIEDFIEDALKQQKLVKHIDELSRTLCPDLEHFVVLTNTDCERFSTSSKMGSSAIERIIENRAAQTLPGKFVRFGELNGKQLVNSNEFIINLTNVYLLQMDIMLCSADPIATSNLFIDKNVNKNLQQFGQEKILNLLNALRPNFPTEMQLKDLGLNTFILLEVKAILVKNLNIILTLKEIKMLTLKKLKHLFKKSKATTENVFENFKVNQKSRGIRMLLRDFNNLSLYKSTLVDIMNSLSTTRPTILIPGLLSSANSNFCEMLQNITSPTLVLQLPNNFNCISVKELALSVIDDVKSVLRNSNAFYLIGYSFGALVALELASLLEEAGLSGKVLLIDGAPKLFKQLISNELDKCIDDDLIDIILSELVLQITTEQSQNEIKQQFILLNTLEQKFDKFLEYVKTQNIYTFDYAQRMIKLMMNRLYLANDIDLEVFKPIKSPIGLVRPDEVIVSDIDYDYDVSKLTASTTFVRVISGDHNSILNNSKLYEIINKFDPIQDEMKKFQHFMSNGKQIEN